MAMAVHESCEYACHPVHVEHPTPEAPASFTGPAVCAACAVAGSCHGGQVSIQRVAR